MLVGRAEEVARVERVLADARLGVSAALVIEGEGGIGKTSLLEHAVGAATSMRVLRVRGVEFEADVPFAGLHALLRPALGSIERLSVPGAAALRSALGMGPRAESDRLLIGAATLELLIAWAETAPLLVVVDDAHWLDRASAEALAFAARRLLADPVALLVGLREGEPSPLLEIGLPVLRLPGLPPEAAAALVDAAAPARLSQEAVQRIVQATAGNPLALVEMAAAATRVEQVAGEAPLPIETTVERSYLRRAVQLSAGARAVLLVLAASGSADIELLGRAAARLGLGPSPVAEAEAASGLVRSPQPRTLEFVHPLARAAIYHSAAPSDRRAAHTALASVLEDADRRAWHLAAAADGADEKAATALAAAAGRARDRTAHAAAASAFEEAARLTAAAGDRDRRLLLAAESAWLAGQEERALRLLARARADADDDLTSELDALGGHIAVRQGDFESGYRLLSQAAARVAARDRPRAIHLLADASLVGLGSGRVDDMLATSRRAVRLLRAGDPPATEVAARTALGAALALAGHGDEGPRHLRRVADLFAGADLPGGDPLLMICAGITGLFLREVETSRELLEKALAGARTRAPAAALPAVLFYLGRDAATTDRWAEARGHYEEGARLARETNQPTWLAGHLAGLVWVDAQEGRTDDLETHAAEVDALAHRHQLDYFQTWVLAARGLCEQGAGRPAAAREWLERLRELLGRLGIRDPDVDPAPELVDVLVRLGDLDRARAETAAFHELARAKGQPFALARAERARGLTAGDRDFAAHFDAALAHHAGTRDTFEAARTELVYGERLRRTRRRGEARRRLSRALEAFDRLGATAWVGRALGELGATGETLGPRDEAFRHRLTPQELQIALALAQGLTTRETAAKFFLSPKTVEYHLRNVYDKLEVRTREELRGALGGAESPSPAGSASLAEPVRPTPRSSSRPRPRTPSSRSAPTP